MYESGDREASEASAKNSFAKEEARDLKTWMYAKHYF